MHQRLTGWNLLDWIRNGPGILWLTVSVFLVMPIMGQGAPYQKIQPNKTVSTEFYNATPIINQMVATMKHENLTEMATKFKQCHLDGFYNIGQDTMYREHLIKNMNYHQPEQLCASLETDYSHDIDDHECTAKLKFICRVNDTAQSGDLVYKGATYRLVNQKMSWPHARDYCYQIQGTLATADSVNETDGLIRKLIKHLNDMHLLERFWIGIRKLDFCYSGIPAVGIKWQDGEPNYKFRCVALMKDTGTGEVDIKAKTINCSTTDTSATPGWTNSTSPPGPGNDTTTPLTPGNQNTGKIAWITVGLLAVIIIGIICLYCFCGERIRRHCSKKASKGAELKEGGHGSGMEMKKPEDNKDTDDTKEQDFDESHNPLMGTNQEDKKDGALDKKVEMNGTL